MAFEEWNKLNFKYGLGTQSRKVSERIFLCNVCNDAGKKKEVISISFSVEKWLPSYLVMMLFNAPSCMLFVQSFTSSILHSTARNAHDYIKYYFQQKYKFSLHMYIHNIRCIC